MGVVLVGLSHKTAPLELRERLTVPKSRLEKALNQLKKMEPLLESVVLSTCNRLEVYARPGENKQEALKMLFQFFETIYADPKLKPALYHYDSEEAVQHLFRVAAGLDSLVLGETDILGQVKSAYQFAKDNGATGKIINVLFQRALFVGKKVRAQTEISDGASSVGSLAVRLAERIFGALENHRVVLVGAGKMAEVTARHILSQKAGHLTILNRTLSKAEQLANLLNGTAGSLDALPNELHMADIVICSAASGEPLITVEMVQPIMVARRQRSLYFIDIAVPRNVHPDVHALDNVYLYNIDDLQTIVKESSKKRKGAIDAAEKLVKAMAQECFEWVIGTLRGQQLSLRHRHTKAKPSL